MSTFSEDSTVIVSYYRYEDFARLKAKFPGQIYSLRISNESRRKVILQGSPGDIQDKFQQLASLGKLLNLQGTADGITLVYDDIRCADSARALLDQRPFPWNLHTGSTSALPAPLSLGHRTNHLDGNRAFGDFSSVTFGTDDDFDQIQQDIGSFMQWFNEDQVSAAENSDQTTASSRDQPSHSPGIELRDSELRRNFDIKFDDLLNAAENRTTLMIRNIPTTYTREDIQAIFRSVRLEDDVIRLHVPRQFHDPSFIKGYAFVTMTDVESTRRMYMEMHGRVVPDLYSSPRTLALSFARLQETN
jgi:hypothetical protein